MENVTFAFYCFVVFSEPNIEPTLDVDYPLYITNNSISIHWKINPTICENINGIFLGFTIELKVNPYE